MTRTDRSRWAAVAVVAVLGLLGGCASGDTDTDGPASPTVPSVTDDPTPDTGRAEPDDGPDGPGAAPTPAPRGLVYYAGRRARTGEWLLLAEQTGFLGRTELLAAVRAAMAGPPADADYTSLWSGNVVDRVTLLWDGDEGYFSVRLDEAATTRPPGMSMREAHLAIQQVVWTLGSVGRVQAPVRFRVGRSDEPVTDLLGIPATGPDDTYLAADHRGVLSSMNILTPADGATVDGVVEISGLAESFEATVGIRVVDAGGGLVADDATQAEECCGRLFPWTYSLDTSGWPPGAYTLSALTDDPVGIAQGSDGPEIDTKAITVR